MVLPPPEWPPMVTSRLLAVARSLRAGVGLQSHVIAQRAALKDVVPGGDGQRGNLNVRVVLFNRPLLPVTVVSGMIEPILKVRRQGVRQSRAVLSELDVEDRKLAQRQNRAADQGIRCLAESVRLKVSCGQRRGPGFVEPLLECAALIGPVLVIVTRPLQPGRFPPDAADG